MASNKTTLRLVVDNNDQTHDDLTEIDRLLVALPGDIQAPVCRAARDLLEHGFVCRHVKTAVRTTDIHVVIEPSEAVVALLAALRTGDRNALLGFVHRSPL